MILYVSNSINHNNRYLVCYWQEKSHVRGPLLLNPVYEQLCMTLLQEIFSVARNKEDMQLRQNSAWALAFLRHHWVSKEYLNQNISRSDSPEAKQLSQNIAEDTVVCQLSSWLRDLNVFEVGNFNSFCQIFRLFFHLYLLFAIMH